MNIPLGVISVDIIDLGMSMEYCHYIQSLLATYVTIMALVKCDCLILYDN